MLLIQIGSVILAGERLGKMKNILMVSLLLTSLMSLTALAEVEDVELCNDDEYAEMYISYDSRYGAKDWQGWFKWEWRNRTHWIAPQTCWKSKDISLTETKGASPAAIKNMEITYHYRHGDTPNNNVVNFPDFSEGTKVHLWGTMLNDEQVSVEPYLNKKAFNFRWKRFINGDFSDMNYLSSSRDVKGPDQQAPYKSLGYDREYVAAFRYEGKSYAFTSDGLYSMWENVLHHSSFSDLQDSTKHTDGAYTEKPVTTRYPGVTQRHWWQLTDQDVYYLSGAVERDGIAYFFMRDGTYTTYNLRREKRLGNFSIKGAREDFSGLNAAVVGDYVRAAVKDTMSGNIFLFYGDKYSVWSPDGKITETAEFKDGNWQGLGFRKNADGSFKYDNNGILFKGADITAMLTLSQGDAFVFIKNYRTGQPKWLALDVAQRKTVGHHSRNEGYNIHHTYLRGIDALRPYYGQAADFSKVNKNLESNINKEPAPIAVQSSGSTMYPLSNEIRLHATPSLDISITEPVLAIWDFGDGSGSPETGITEIVTHQYKSAGEYTITLTVENVDGRSSEPTQSRVTVFNDAVIPVVNSSIILF